MIDKGPLGDHREYKENEVREACISILQGVKELNIPLLMTLSGQELYGKLAKNPLCIRKYYDLLSKNEVLKKYIGHDLNNLATGIYPILELYSIRPNDKNIKEIFKRLSRFAYIMEDICLRGIDEKDVDNRHNRPFEIEDIGETLDLLIGGINDKISVKKTSLANGRYRYLDEDTKIDVSSRLEKIPRLDFTNVKLLVGEHLHGVPGVFINALSNTVRNAAGEFLKKNEVGEVEMVSNLPIEVGAEHVKVTANKKKFDGKECISFKVTDDGVGMPQSYLDPNSENFIFRFGRSHRLSSGYGLTNMPERLESMGTKMTVWTIKKDSGKVSLYDNSGYPKKEAQDRDITESDWLAEQKEMIEKQVGFKPSTVFEFLLPILKAE